MSKQKTKKVLGIISNVFLYAFLILAILLVIMSVSAKKNGGDAITLFGKQMRIVVSASMEACEETDVSDFEIKSIPVKSMIFIDTAPADEQQAKTWYSALKVNDVCTFTYSYGGAPVVITHRIIDIDEDPAHAGHYIIKLRGDNQAGVSSNVELGVQTINTYENFSGRPAYNKIIGKVTGQSKLLGFITYIVRQPIGLALIVIVPCAIIIIMEVIKIVGVFGAEKKSKIKEEHDKQQSEIDELKRQLAELTKSNAETNVSQADDTGDVPLEESSQTPVQENPPTEEN